MKSKQIRAIVTRPQNYLRFVSEGKVPRMIRPEGPLIELLRSISPRDRMCILGVRVDGRLGYHGSRSFHTAEQALRWCAPSDEMVDGEWWPAESWQIKTFRQRLTIDDLLASSSRFPEEFRQKYTRGTRW